MASESSWTSSWIDWCTSELTFWRISWRGQSVILLKFFKIRIIIIFMRGLLIIFFLIMVVFRAFMVMIFAIIMIMVLLGIMLFFRGNRSAFLFLFLVLTYIFFLILRIFIFLFFFTLQKKLNYRKIELKFLLTIFSLDSIFLHMEIFQTLFLSLFYQQI